MRGLLKIAQFAVTDCLTLCLCALGLAFVLAQIVVLRRRYIYIGLLGLGCLMAGVRRGLHPDGPTDMVLMAIEVLSFANAVVFMVKNSWDNVRAVRAEADERRRRLIAELGEIAAAARPKGDGAASPPEADIAGGPKEET